MKILLLYPEFPGTYWSFRHALKLIRKKKAGGAPMGLRTVAAMLSAGWKIRLIDLHIMELNEEDPA